MSILSDARVLTSLSPSYRPSIISPAGSPAAAAGTSARKASAPAKPSPLVNIEDNSRPSNEEVDSDEEDAIVGHRDTFNRSTGLSSLFPSFSTSKYARHKENAQNHIKLPPGIRHPGIWIKDQGPLRVEAKVWLANQRTFIKWQHVSVLLASLSLGLYNAAGETNNIARILAVVYTCVALFTLLWGYGMYMWRRKLITERSGKDFDNVVGPLVVAVGLAVALCLNFGFKVSSVM